MLPPQPRSTLFPYTTLFRSLQALIHLDTSLLVDALTGPRRSGAALRRALERGERLALSPRSEEHTSELQSLTNLVCRLLLEKKKKKNKLTLVTMNVLDTRDH